MKNISAIGALLFLLFVTKDAEASCPVSPCRPVADASTIAGSNADQKLITFTQNITTTTNEVAKALIDMANANASSVSSAAQQVVSSNLELSQIELNQTLKVKKAMSDREMAHSQQLAENAYREASSVVSKDDTKEEFELILDTLDEYSEKSVPEIILILTESMDKDPENGFVNVRLPDSQGVCKDSDVEEEGKCAIAKRVYPGEKLEALFKQCSADKRLLVEMEAGKETRVAMADVNSRKTAKAIDTVNSSGAVIARAEKNKELACTPSQYKAGSCAAGVTPEDYQEKIVIGDIIPSGDLSAGNFNSPSEIASPGFIEDLSEKTRKEVRQQSLDRRPLIRDPNQRVVPFNYTYRNANQVSAANAFIDNIVADDLVPALSPGDRRKVNNAEYQSRHLSRTAALSMIRLALSESMAQRVGQKMAGMLKSGQFLTKAKFTITPESPANKESVLGASPLDILQDRVNQQSGALQTSDQNGNSPNSGNDFVSQPNEANSLERIVDNLLLQNEMLIKEYFMNEQIIALKAVTIAQEVNSPQMTALMEDLRRGR
jgi:hypothetical protein